MPTQYNPFSDKGWEYGDKLPGRDEWHKYLGPCPKCGTACWDYGGGWRCMAMYCSNNASNPISNLGPMPEWWNTNILIKKDGDAWCAHYDDFINLQESISAFGNTPEEAINDLQLIDKQPSTMTKEEILAKLQKENPSSIPVFKAMDEWAIEFGKWMQGCNYAPATDDGKWQNQLPGENDIITTEELHSQFIEQQK